MARNTPDIYRTGKDAYIEGVGLIYGTDDPIYRRLLAFENPIVTTKFHQLIPNKLQP
jgi:hypothetical protein